MLMLSLPMVLATVLDVPHAARALLFWSSE
jgi:hypothetical protein